jgi:hydroxymethylbilane synthase
MAHRPPSKLGTRRSPLAMAQAEEARDRLLRGAWLEPGHGRDRPGDRQRRPYPGPPLAEIGGKALWTKELDAWLLERRDRRRGPFGQGCRDDPPAGYRHRRDPAARGRARRAGRRGLLAALPQGARIGTSAPRRAAQALHARPDCRVVTFRGNVATRLAKLAAGEADATLLAAGGPEPAGRERRRHMSARSEDWLPAPGQGAIAIECRSNDEADTRALLSAIDDLPPPRAVEAERALLAALGGNCHSARFRC